jgi:hypothetical protein
MKVLEGCKGIAPGTMVSLSGSGLPVEGRRGLLIVFWKAM